MDREGTVDQYIYFVEENDLKWTLRDCQVNLKHLNIFRDIFPYE